MIRFDNGAIATAEANFSASYGYDVRGEVFGSAGMVSAGDTRQSSMTLHTADGRVTPTVRGDVELFARRLHGRVRRVHRRRAGGPRAGGDRTRCASRAGDRAGLHRVGHSTGGPVKVGAHEPAYRLAASAEMLFIDLPFVERVERIHELGFLVEIWDWTAKDIDALVATGAEFSSMTGYIEGDLTDRTTASRGCWTTAEQSIPVAHRLSCPRLNLHGTGLDGDGLPVRPVEVVTDEMWRRAEDTLARVAALGEREGVVFTLENLNTAVDHPGTPFARAEDTLALVSAVDSPGLRLNLDLYHAQIGEGNLIELVRRCLPWIGEIQVADVPGRCEPGTGEINYPAIARALIELGYDGVVGLEAWASTDPETALTAFRTAFTP